MAGTWLLNWMFLEAIQMASPASPFGVRTYSQFPEIRLRWPHFLDQLLKYVNISQSCFLNGVIRIKIPNKLHSWILKDNIVVFEHLEWWRSFINDPTVSVWASASSIFDLPWNLTEKVPIFLDLTPSLIITYLKNIHTIITHCFLDLCIDEWSLDSRADSIGFHLRSCILLIRGWETSRCSPPSVCFPSHDYFLPEQKMVIWRSVVRDFAEQYSFCLPHIFSCSFFYKIFLAI